MRPSGPGWTHIEQQIVAEGGHRVNARLALKVFCVFLGAFAAGFAVRDRLAALWQVGLRDHPVRRDRRLDGRHLPHLEAHQWRGHCGLMKRVG